MGELIAAMSAAAPAAAGSAGTAASLAGPAAGSIGSMFAAPAAAPASSLGAGLLGNTAAATPFFSTPEAFMGGVPVAEGVGMGAMGPMFDAAQLPFATAFPGAAGAWDQALTTGLPANAGTAAKGFPWEKAAGFALSQMKNGPETIPGGMGSRPPGYDPKEPMEKQFARIMGWLQENGGRL